MLPDLKQTLLVLSMVVALVLLAGFVILMLNFDHIVMGIETTFRVAFNYNLFILYYNNITYNIYVYNNCIYTIYIHFNYTFKNKKILIMLASSFLQPYSLPVGSFFLNIYLSFNSII